VVIQRLTLHSKFYALFLSLYLCGARREKQLFLSFSRACTLGVLHREAYDRGLIILVFDT
jgi:hypothetical protein